MTVVNKIKLEMITVSFRYLIQGYESLPAISCDGNFLHRMMDSTQHNVAFDGILLDAPLVCLPTGFKSIAACSITGHLGGSQVDDSRIQATGLQQDGGNQKKAFKEGVTLHRKAIAESGMTVKMFRIYCNGLK